MLLVIEDINDELFRRAADNYPLRTDKPDWESVVNKMNAANNSEEPDPAPKKRNRYSRYLLLLLLLIPFAIFEKNNFRQKSFTPVNNNNASQDKNAGKDEDKKISAGNKETNDKNPQTTTPQLSNTTAKQITAAVEPASVQNKAVNTNNSSTSIAKNNNLNNSIIADGNTNKHITPSSKFRSGINAKNAPVTAADDIAGTTGIAGSTKNKKKKKIKSNSSIAIIASVPEEDGSVNNIAAADPKQDKTTVDVTDNKLPKTDSTAKEKIRSADSTAKKTEKEIAKADDNKTGKEKNKKKEREKHFYVGLVAAPDFSAVKLQSMKKIGFNYGFLLGYKLTNKLSIETGLLQDKKYYSTNGKYFSVKELYVGGGYNATIEYATGACKMLEIPLNITYTFRQKNTSSWFGSAGMSSYFMQHEDYVYDLYHNGYRYPKAFDYDNKSTAFFAVVNIGAGYTHKIGKIGDLRIEPYLRLPVSKIGTGNLPIQSGGVFIGFTKKIF